MDKLLVVRYGEIALKGNNRHLFEARLLKNIKLSLKPLGETKVTKEHGRMFVAYHGADHDQVTQAIKRVFGVWSFSPAEVMPLDLDQVAKVGVEQVKALMSQKHIKTFKVETKRPNKKFHLKSPEVSRLIGGHILKACTDLKVDVHQPDITVHVELRDKAYVYTDVIRCQGGMPYKSAGKAMLLLSGGIDSPVAAFLMARRGLEIEAVHFHSYPFTSERAQEKVYDLARKLAVYTDRVRVHSINLLNIQKQIAEKCPSEEMTILSRRFMMAIATQVALDRNCKALVTGESLGQVASQTIEGINVTTDATHLPVFRPLIAMDKLDIMDIARQIDTYETSILPFEDCCTVFLPDRVVTKPRVEDIQASEALLDKEELIKQAIEEMEVILIKQEETFDF